MAKKRKSSEGLDEAVTFDSNDNTRLLEADFQKLCKEAHFESLDGQRGSPAKHQSRLWKYYMFLWYKNRWKLDAEVNEFLTQLPSLPPNQRSADILLAKLEPVVTITKTPSAIKFKDTDIADDAEPAPPASPSRGRGLTRAFKASKSTNNAPQMPKLQAPLSPPPALERTSTKKPLVQTTIFQIMGSLIRPVAGASGALGVSFESTTEANPSFNKTSFWSDAQGTQRTANTAATSFSEDEHPAESTDYGSVFSMGQANGLLQSLESSQRPDSAMRTLSRRAKSDVTSRNSEFYCSSIDTQTADEFQVRADIFHAESHERRDTITTVVEDAQKVTEEIAEDAQTHITTVNAGIYNHEGPCKRQRLGLKPIDEPPETGLVSLKLARQFRDLEFDLQWEVQRVLQTGAISPDVLDADWGDRTVESLYELVSERKIRLQHPPKLEAGTMKQWEVHTRSAKLEWSKTGPALKMVPQVQRKDTSCSLERKFGADRVLHVEIPDLAKQPASTKHRNIQARFTDWLKTPQDFLGRAWSLYFLKPTKKNNTLESRLSTSVATLIFVSPPSGWSIKDVVQWYLPFDTNKCQASRKAYMRLELAVSRTIPVTVLQPEDIVYRVQDKLATNDSDDRRFEDPHLSHQFYEEYDPSVIMSDGCNRMSRWVAMQFANIVGLDKVPPVLQIRVAGSKGLWYIDRESEGDSLCRVRPPGPLIHLANSQVKVFRDSLLGCDDETLTIGVVKANMSARPSILHMLFLPILVDRGVPLATICEFVANQVSEELQGFLQALEREGGLPIRQWLACRQHWFESIRRENGIEVLAGFPKSTEESIIQMLESGFDPKENACLARDIRMLAAQFFDLKNRNFQIKLPASTTLWGIADPEDCLEPGEVCVNLGGWFDGQPYRMDDRDVLVARNPALATWDIQKVRCVEKPQLARFTGMIIFSAKGKRPLANKLQGGDYDGDPYWVTWEEKLVADFKNAPAPLMAPHPETFGIRRDRQLLADHIRDPDSDQQWRHWLGNMALKRLSNNMLGIVTLFHERLLYNGCPAGDEEAVNIVHCHDYLVDSDKQGYDYDILSFEAYKRSRNISRRFPNLRNPTYWKITKHAPTDDKSKPVGIENIIGDGILTNNVIDVIFFEVAEPIIKRTLERARVVLEKAANHDPQLALFYNQTIASYQDNPAARKEMLRLREKLQAVKANWAATHWNKDNTAETRELRLQALRDQYDAIQPENPFSATAVEWLRRQGNCLTTWQKLKASALASLYGISGTLQFRIAGAELCSLKANEVMDPCRTLVESQYCALKVRKPKTAWSPEQALGNIEMDEDAVVETAYY